MGDYVYRSKWGQVEVLRLAKDDSFTQELYSDEKSYISGAQPLFSHSGKIIEAGGMRKAEMLNFSMLTLEPVRSRPDFIWRLHVTPVSPVADYRPGFIFDEQDYYWLLKVDSRSDISRLKFQYP